MGVEHVDKIRERQGKREASAAALVLVLIL